MLLSAANIQKTINYMKRNGFKETVYASAERIWEKRKYKYAYEEPSTEELERQREKAWAYRPLISLVVPAYETKPVYMEDLILSVADQTYDHYELIIADASESRQVERIVRELSAEFEKIKYVRLDSNEGISENTNRGIGIAKGDYIALLDHDDLLAPDALFLAAEKLEALKGRDLMPFLCYTDEDKTNAYLEKFYEPNRKPAFDLDLLLTNNYICHLCFFRKDVIQKLLLRREYDGAQDHDLILRTAALAWWQYGTDWKKYFCHVPKVVYHWRCHDASTAENPSAKLYAYEAGKRAVEDFLLEMQIEAKVVPLKHFGFYRVEYPAQVWKVRPDIGIVGGPIYGAKGMFGRVITGGAMNAKGRVLYEGMPEHFSGQMHRAVLQQEVDAVDVRNMEVREDLVPLFEKTFGFSYAERDKEVERLLKKGENEKILRKNLVFCNKARQKGIFILYDPVKGESREG